jgi:anti-anti-sigma factor
MINSLAIVQAHGSLNASNAKAFQVRLLEQIQHNHASGLAVDMSQVDSLDSAGLIALVAALKHARQRSKRLYLCAVPPAIRIVFELTQLDRAFEMLEEVPQLAVAA